MESKTISVSQTSLPKGGGAIKGIGETFQPHEFCGTAGLSIPIPTSPCRGFEPHLSLDYSSGSGNGIFGLGFSLSIPNISRKTAKGIPRYRRHRYIYFVKRRGSGSGERAAAPHRWSICDHSLPPVYRRAIRQDRTVDRPSQ